MKRSWVLLSFFLLSGCVIPTAALNTINCDPKNRDDCYSVTEEFLVEHFDVQERHKKTVRALKSCQQKL
jgi:hypothetical protein